MSVNTLLTVSVPFAAGQTVSSPVRVEGSLTIVAIETDAALTAASLTVASSTQNFFDYEDPTDAGITYKACRDGVGTAVTFGPLVASSIHCLSQEVMLVGNFYKFTASSAQVSASTITLTVRRVGQ